MHAPSTAMDSDEEEDKSSSSDEGSCHNSSSNNLKLLSAQSNGGSGGSLNSHHSNGIFSNGHTSSMGVFLEFLRIIPEENGEIDPVNGRVDANEIVSKACFDRWLAARKIPPTKPEKSFQRTLSAHLTGLDGRSPFEPRQEAAILEVLRKPQRWPCFENESVKFGLRGFRAKGYHEKKRAEAAAGAGEPNVKTVMVASTAQPPQPQQQPPMLTMNFAAANVLPLQQQHVPQLSGLFPPVHQPQHQQPFPLDSPRFSMFPTFAQQQQQQQQHYVDSMRFVMPKHVQQPTPNIMPPQLFPRITQTPFSPTSAAAATAMLESQKRLRGSVGVHFPEVFSVVAPPAPQIDQETRFLESANEILLNATLGRTSSTASLLDGNTNISNKKDTAWREVINLAKISLLAKGWGNLAIPLQTNADMVVAAYERTNPCALVLIIDVLENESRLRVMAQSQCARMFLGPITRNEAGLTDYLLGDEDENAWKLLTAMVEAFRFPDHESKGVEIKLKSKNLQGVFTVYAKVFSVEHLVALQAVPCT